MSKRMIKKCIEIEEALQKMGWRTEASFINNINNDLFYITITKRFEGRNQDDPSTWNKDKTYKIRFSDHELPPYNSSADFECRFDENKAAWSELKPKLKKLFMEAV